MQIARLRGRIHQSVWTDSEIERQNEREIARLRGLVCGYVALLWVKDGFKCGETWLNGTRAS